MPRQTRQDKLLAAKEAALEVEVAQAAAVAESKGAELKLVRSLRKELAALPKRSARSKPKAVPTAPTATAA